MRSKPSLATHDKSQTRGGDLKQTITTMPIKVSNETAGNSLEGEATTKTKAKVKVLSMFESTMAETPPCTKHTTKDKQNKQYHTQSRGVEGSTMGVSDSIVPNEPNPIDTRLIVVQPATTLSLKNSTKPWLKHPTEKTKQEQSGEHDLLGQSKGKAIQRTKNKKRTSPCAKQWRCCGCGRLYHLWTGLCACTEMKILPWKSI